VTTGLREVNRKEKWMRRENRQQRSLTMQNSVKMPLSDKRDKVKERERERESGVGRRKVWEREK